MLTEAHHNIHSHKCQYDDLTKSYNESLEYYSRLIRLDVDRTSRGLSEEEKKSLRNVLFNLVKRNMEHSYC